MSQLNKSSFLALYGTNSGPCVFIDNTSGLIGADDTRAFAVDIKDSFINRTDDTISSTTFTGATSTNFNTATETKTYILGAKTYTDTQTFAAGTTTNPPLKLTSGTALTTPQAGALEFHSSHLYFTIGSTRYQLDQQTGIVSNGAANNELMKSDGTNAVASGLFSTLGGSVNLGSASISGGRTIAVVSSTTDSSLSINSQGGTGSSVSINSYLSVNGPTAPARNVSIGDGSVCRILFYGTAALLPTAEGTTVSLSTAARVTNGTSADLFLSSGDGGVATNGGTGNVYVGSGTKTGTGLEGNLGIHSSSGSFGGGEKVIYIHNAKTIPSSNPTAGGILYVESGALKYRGSSGTITTIAVA